MSNVQLFASIGTAIIFVFTTLTHYNIDQELTAFKLEQQQLLAEQANLKSAQTDTSSIPCSDEELAKLNQEAEEKVKILLEEEESNYAKQTQNEELQDHPGSVKFYLKKFPSHPPGYTPISGVTVNENYKAISDWSEEYSNRKNRIRHVCSNLQDFAHTPRNSLDSVYKIWEELETKTTAENTNSTVGFDQPWLLINDGKKMAYCDMAEPQAIAMHELVLGMADKDRMQTIHLLHEGAVKLFKDHVNTPANKPWPTHYQPLHKKRKKRSATDGLTSPEADKLFIQQHDLPTRREILNPGGYHKVVVGRHPLERLLLVYLKDGKDRLAMPSGLTPQTKGLPTEKEHLAKQMERQNFFFFLRFLTLREPSYFTSNTFRMWRSQEHLCHLCSIDYDFVGKAETLEHDYKEVQKLMGGNPDFSKSWSEEELFAHDKVPDSEIEYYYHGISKGLLTDLYEDYKLDFELFGYTIPQKIWDNAHNW